MTLERKRIKRVNDVFCSSRKKKHECEYCETWQRRLQIKCNAMQIILWQLHYFATKVRTTVNLTTTALNTLNCIQNPKKESRNHDSFLFFLCQVFMVPIWTSIVFLIVTSIDRFEWRKKKSGAVCLHLFCWLTYCHQYKLRLSFAINVKKCKFSLTNPYFYGGFKWKYHY